MNGTGASAELLAETVRLAGGSCFPPVDSGLFLEPFRLRENLERSLAGSARRVRIAGSLDRRLLLVERRDGRWAAGDLSGQPHETRAWPAWAAGRISLETPGSWLSLATLDDLAVYRVSRPIVLLAALYHPEYFPLPRFPLGISDVARAARATLIGDVRLADMQLSVTLEGMIGMVEAERPDILGVSATFGQHDLMVALLDAAYRLPRPPLVIAGGSLTARNEALLLERFPRLLIARGGGEATIEGLLAHWHADIGLDQVPGLGFNGAARGGALAVTRRRTARPVTRDATADIIPELDLLAATFEHHGVAQLETSRGCTNFCSFCPRGHKGSWTGTAPRRLPWLLAEMRRVFDRYPHISRTLYLVDEEFIGHDHDAADRALEVARAVHEAGFRWESSCRVDQVARPGEDLAWHAGRVLLWRELVRHGLRRMLFGVESGVDSILERFSKETTSEQNAVAIRTLSAAGVPTRFTYITFDPLMTLEELKASYAFQGRADLLLRPTPHLSAGEIARGVRDAEFTARAATGRPFHSAISYMLVSMECLTGSAYTRAVRAAGLAGAARPSMGRADARFADWRIGIASRWAQLWVDRHFTLDYTLKSLEKVLDGQPRLTVRQARVVLKDAAYAVLGEMITAIDAQPLAGAAIGEQRLSADIGALLDARVQVLRARMGEALPPATAVLPASHARMLDREYGRWDAATGWRLINAADPCGT
ncbi:MAG TPA: radical SAM protein [Streptosporangiaceae bacterium]|nr:radical SAM protein [Streptosporangiaceae bacterium]